MTKGSPGRRRLQATGQQLSAFADKTGGIDRRLNLDSGNQRDMMHVWSNVRSELSDEENDAGNFGGFRTDGQARRFALAIAGIR